MGSAYCLGVRVSPCNDTSRGSQQTSARVPDTSMTLSFGHRSVLSPRGTALASSQHRDSPSRGGTRTVGHDQAGEARFVDVLDCLAAQDAVSDNRVDLASAMLVDSLGCLDELHDVRQRLNPQPIEGRINVPFRKCRPCRRQEWRPCPEHRRREPFGPRHWDAGAPCGSEQRPS